MRKKSPRRRTAVRRKKSRATARTRNAIDVVRLIDTNFNRRVAVIENGKPSRMTVFAAIYKQLWTREMGGDPKALKVRLMYEAFARKQQPKQPRDIIVVGGLLDCLPNKKQGGDV